MECREARRLAEYARPGVAELDAADLAALERHWVECATCSAAQNAERRADERITAAMHAVAIPSGARLRLETRLLAERRTWWQVRALAAAIILIAGALTTVATIHWNRPVFDPGAIVLATYEQSGQWRSAEEARGVADRWLREIDRRLVAPDEWNYKLLAFFERADFQGLTSVPMLALSRGEATARIYVVRASVFRNLEAFDQPIEDGGCTVAVRRYPELPGWAFIVVISGGPLELFLRPIPQRLPA